MKKLFCKIYEVWISRIIADKHSPLVVVMDYLIGSPCKYCFAVRAGMVGAGLPLLWFVPWAGVILVLLALGLTYGERKLLCEFKPKDPR